jgi:uncharacterized protein (TIGR00369 family)
MLTRRFFSTSGSAAVFQARANNFEQRVRDSFSQQTAMATLGATLRSVAPGRVVVDLARRSNLTQQHGFIHGGVLAAVMDSACGYAAFSLFEEKDSVLSTGFSVNLLSPADVDHVEIVGQVLKSGRTLSIVEAEARRSSDQKLIAKMTASIMVIKHLQEGVGAVGNSTTSKSQPKL